MLESLCFFLNVWLIDLGDGIGQQRSSESRIGIVDENWEKHLPVLVK